MDADPLTEAPRVELPLVFPGNQRGLAGFWFACGVLTLPIALGKGTTALLLWAATLLSAQWYLWRPASPYVVVETDGVEINVAGGDPVVVSRDSIDRIEHSLNGLRLVQLDGSHTKISFLEMRRRDVSRLLPALRLMMSGDSVATAPSSLHRAAGQS